MSTPNLPLTYQLETTAAAPASDLVHICSSVISEGGDLHTGILHYESTAGTHINANTADTIYVIGALRLKSTHLDAIVEVVSVSAVAATSDAYEWVLFFNPTVSGSLTYNGVENSAVEYAVGDGTQTITGFTGGRQIVGGFASAAAAIDSIVEETRHIGALVDGTRDVIALGVRPLSANLDIDGGIAWRELQ